MEVGPLDEGSAVSCSGGWFTYEEMKKMNTIWGICGFLGFWASERGESTSEMGVGNGDGAVVGGGPVVAVVMVFEGRKTGKWWLRVGTEVVGYWPASLFNELCDYAKIVEYGGEVMYANTGRHTSTQMGSGHFESGPGKTAYARNLKVLDSSNAMKDVTNLETLAEKPNCYGVQKGYNDVYRNYIYSGGPGNSPKCP
ncbi:protein neprosin-like [Bidens hawaiensis]|uniref:protein neprosin-like n=1 Tax=Bidens hawaiensis TaxID=980011 RepID=UPI00404B6DF7